MKISIRLSFFLMFILMSACNSEQQVLLDTNLALWDEQNKSYSYDLQTNALPLLKDTTVRVEVIDNQVSTATIIIAFGDFEVGAPVPEEIAALIPTIDSHFIAMRGFLISDTFEASYDVNLGYPTQYSVNIDSPFTEDVDESIEGQHISISNFIPL